MAVELAPELLEILACPNCHGGLAVDHDRDELVCTAPDCRLAYPVKDGIPVLLVDEARPPKAAAPQPEPAEGQPRPEPAAPPRAEPAAPPRPEPVEGQSRSEPAAPPRPEPVEGPNP